MSANKKPLSRRSFIQTTGLGAAAVPLFSARSYARVQGANNRLRIGMIGCGGMARAHLNALLDIDDVEVVALCDVYETRARAFQDQVYRSGGRAKRIADYRKLLEVEGLDYVNIATPEHWHHRQTLDALEAGLHVYCEKPITLNVDEAHQVLDKVSETGLKMQVGVQGMSDDSYSSAFQAIRDGKLGPVVQAQIDYVRNHSMERGPWRTGVDPKLPQPDDLDWESWLGPAQNRPWDAKRFFEWRCYRDYSGGVASDLFVHRLTRIIKACGLGYPTRVTGMGGITLWDDGRELPDNFEMLAEYPAVEGVTPGMTVHVLGTMGNSHRNEHLIRGHDATLIFNREGWQIVEQGTGELVEEHTKTGAESVSLHHRNLHAAIRSDKDLRCPAKLGVLGLTAVAGANQSWFEKRMLEWDATGRRWA